MVKIIKRGSLPEARKYRVTCQVCGTVAEFTHNEGRYSSDQRDGNIRIFKCPVCNKDCWTNAGGHEQQWER